jgi:AraC-like DNA-binding protein
MFDALPDLPYRWKELQAFCGWLSRRVAPLTCGGYRLPWLEVRVDAWEPGWHVGTHTHSFYECHLFLDGQGLYTVDQAQKLGPGHAVIHGPHVPHAWQVPAYGAPCRVLVLWFTLEPLPHYALPPQWPLCPELAWDLALLFREVESPLPGRATRVRHRTTTLISRFLAICGTAGDDDVAADAAARISMRDRQFATGPDGAYPPALASPDTVAVVRQFMEDNLAHPLTLAEIATFAGMSERNLIRRFRDWTGETVWACLDRLRMERARRLLLDTQLPVVDVGARVGMPESSYFIRRFRHWYQQTPQQYRRARA